MPQTIPDPDSDTSDFPLEGGQSLSPGFAGVTPEQARERWADESHHHLTQLGAYEW